ncbi:MAG: YfhO family protein [Patescibacteria group bacterium]
MAIFIIVAAFFWKVIFKSEIPFPGDFVVGVYHPWIDYKWGYPAGVPVKNPITTDVPSFIYPMQTFAIESLKSGKLPLWNPLILAGTPLLANFQSAPFSPTAIFYFLTDKTTAWSIQIVIQHLLAAIFTYFLLRYWKVSKMGSILGGIIFAFSGFNIIWSQWNGHALSAAFIPLIILLEDKWLRESKILYGVLFSLVLALQILAGYPQVVIYTILAIGILYIVRVVEIKNLVSKTFFLIFFGLLAVGLSAFQILPGGELLQYSQRAVEPHPFEWAFLPWEKSITFIAADFFGNHSTKNYWGPQDYTSNTGFVGVVGLMLAMLTINSARKNKEVFYCLIVAVTALVLAFPTPVSVFLWKSGFLGFNAASAHRSLVLWNIAIALLAGFGYDVMSKLKLKRKIIALAVLFVAFLGFGIWAVSINEIVALRNLVLPIVVFVTSSTIVLFKPKFKLVLVLLAIFELFYFGWKFTPFSPKEMVFPTTPVIEFLQNIEKPNRVVADKVIPINFLMNYGIETLEGYDAVYPSVISEYIAAVNGSYGSFNSIRRYAIIDNYDSRLLDLANVKYFVVLKKDEDVYLRNKKFKKIFEDKSVVVLENLNVLPRQLEVKEWEVVENTNELFEKLNSLDFNIGKKIILTETPPAETKSMLFVSDTFYPGWKAYINGAEVKIYRANHAFRAVVVPEGEYRLSFEYHPNSFYNGIKISMVSGMVILGMVGYTLVKGDKHGEN